MSSLLRKQRDYGEEDEDSMKKPHKTAYYRHYRNMRGDPRWMKAKYPGTAIDGTPFDRGDEVLYWPRMPRGKNIMVGDQAQAAWEQFESEAADEEFMNPSGRYGSEKTASLLDKIRPGDVVTIENRFGQKHKGRAVMKGPHGWVLNMGGRHGTPGIADEDNIVKVSKGRRSSAEDWKLKFPSHDRMDLDKTYRKMDNVYRDMRRDDDPIVQRASKEMSKAMSTFVNLLAQLSRTETSLYRKASHTAAKQLTVGKLNRKLWHAIARGIGMPPIKTMSSGESDGEFLTIGGITVATKIRVERDEEGDSVYLDWNSYWDDGGKKSKGTIPIIVGPRQYPRWMTTAVSTFKKEIR